MDASTFKKLARSPVASALVGVVALGALLAMPMRESAARAPAGDGDLAGLARVIDGDTLEIAGRHVRLEGIDAPESGQTCGRRLIGSWRCGSAAADALAKLVAKRRVSCESRGNDKYDRMLGICFVDGRDINAEMVREGFAWAFVKYSQTYVKQEAEARVAARRHLAGRRRAGLGLSREALGRRRAGSAQGLRDQRQRHRSRAHLSHAVEPLVRQGQGRGGEGRALVLQRGGGHFRRMAGSRAAVGEGRLALRASRKNGCATLLFNGS